MKTINFISNIAMPMVILLIVIYGLKKLGPTISAIYSNFLPVTSTFFGWIFLSENISLFQIAGGIIVISAGYVVIREKQINYDN